MATSGSSSFDLNIDDIINEAYERCGQRAMSGYDLKTARRSLNLLFSDWGNRGVHLWKVSLNEVALVSGTAQYAVNESVSDVLEAYISTTAAAANNANTQDVSLTKIDRSAYAALPNKLATGQPSQYFVDRQISPVVKLWPTPDTASTYKLISYNVQRIDDVSTSAEDPEIPSRFMPCLTTGLAYYIAMKKNPERVGLLKQQYEQDFKLAADEDSPRVSLRLTPARSSY